MSTTSTSSLHCTFRVAGLDFGVAVEDVQEVLRHQEMTPVPRSPEAVRGLINLRGQIVIALDLRLRLGLPARAADERPMNVIVRNRGEVVSLLVDDIGDVIDTSEHRLEPVPSTVPLTIQGAVRGVLSLPDSILLVLDPDRAVDVPTAPDATGGTP
ncbi:purine-binding chemotaxis protein CheW [Nocardioides daedukensis]|uniref:Purine-binding chemotaxis protein CheW n=1 Tax=Nocardioides daedukensis TaxID=634462 RepID=A0A7Y9UTN5_9ACTN|nr:chemotaxis protein CheW [Nocardioides daedukensis]NYG58694.1 purine-binding chemotaxis protein CheW [Nocardioides daedukensis]